MNDIEQYLAEVEAIEKAATPGPWMANGAGQWYAGESIVGCCFDDGNTTLCVRARTAIPTFLALVRKYREALEECGRLARDGEYSQCPVCQWCDGHNAGCFIGEALKFDPRKEANAPK